MPMRGELPDAAVRRCTQPSVFAAVISDCDFQAVALFAAIGLVATVNAVLYFPDFGYLLAQLAVFP